MKNIQPVANDLFDSAIFRLSQSFEISEKSADEVIPNLDMDNRIIFNFEKGMAVAHKINNALINKIDEIRILK